MLNGYQKLLGLGLFLIAKVGLSVPAAFERNYVNYAWGYINTGCLVDEDQNLYTYRYGVHGPKMPITLIKKVPVAEFELAQDLAQNVIASGEAYQPKHAAYDAGITTWTASLNGFNVNLKQEGDWEGSLQSPDALQIISLIDSWCNAL